MSLFASMCPAVENCVHFRVSAHSKSVAPATFDLGIPTVQYDRP